MYAFFFSAIISALILIIPGSHQALSDVEGLSVMLIALSALFTFALPLIHALSWQALQKVEQNLTPRLLDMYKHDHQVKWISMWLMAFPIATFALIIAGHHSFSPLDPLIFFCAWLILFGLSLDLLFHLIRRIQSYLNPFGIAEYLVQEAKSAVSEEDSDLFHWLDALSEIAIKAVDRTLPSLCNQIVDDLQAIISQFLVSSKSLAHHIDEGEENNGHDQLSYTLFYVFQRLEIINERAIKHRMEPICSNLITALGRIAIDAAKVDLSLAGYPLHFLGKFAKKAQKNGMEEVADKASFTLLQVGKTILTEVDVTYQNLTDPFFSIILHLEEIAKESFRKDKETSIDLLVEPLNALKEMFQDGTVAEHQDTAVILADINRVLDEFSQLELVLRTIPPLQEEESEMSEKSAEQ